MSRYLLACALTSAVFAAGAARATDLPAATYHAAGDVYSSDFNSGYYGGNFKLTAPGTVSRFSTSVTMGATPSPFIDMSLALVGDEYTDGANATIKYTFMVTGAEDTLVSMKALVVASALVDNSSGDAFGQYNINVDAPQGAGFGIADGGGTYGGFDSFNDTVSFSVMTNQVNTVTIYAAGYINGASGGSHVQIHADPVFSFADPTQGYSLSFSNGIGNTVAAVVTGGVPEPASWALMLIGFGGVGAVVRRRRAQGPAIAA